MNHVFISYSRRNSDAVARCVDLIASRQVPVWFDQRSLPVSVRWLDEIRDAVEESVAVVVFDSPQWRDSTACAAELRLAEAHHKPVVLVSAGDTPEALVGQILAAVASVPLAERESTTVAIRARDWDRGGRRRRDLIGIGEQRRFRRLPHELRGMIVNSFLDASRRRTIARVVTIGIGTVVSVSAGMLVLTLSFGDEILARQTEVGYEYIDAAVQIAEASESEPYEAIRQALELPRDREAAFIAYALNSALASPVPDDAFSVPVEMSGFAEKPVKEIVMVAGPSGQVFGREVDAASREAAPVKSTPSTSAVGTGVEVVAGTGRIVVKRPNGATSAVTVATTADAAALSPDERTVAVASGTKVYLVDVSSGDTRITLAGSPALIVDLAWSDDSKRIWALADGAVVSWVAHQARRVVDDPDADFIWAHLSEVAEDTAWLADRAGRLIEVRLDDGALVREIDLGREVFKAAASADGSIAIVVPPDDSPSAVVDLIGGSTSDVTLPAECMNGQPAFSAAGTVLLPCGADGVQEVDLRSGESIGRFVDVGVAMSVASGPDSAMFFVGTSDGEVFSVNRTNGETRELLQLTCKAEIRNVVVSDTGGVLPLGQGTGRVGCTAMINPPGSPSDIGQFSDDAGWSSGARGAIFFTDDANFAVGHSNGVVSLRPTENLEPRIELRTTPGPIRALLRREAENEIVVVTRDGIVDVYPLPDALISNQLLLAELQTRWDRAVQLGLTAAD